MVEITDPCDLDPNECKANSCATKLLLVTMEVSLGTKTLLHM